MLDNLRHICYGIIIGVLYLQPINGHDYDTIHVDFSVAFCDICPTQVCRGPKSGKHANINVHRNKRVNGREK